MNNSPEQIALRRAQNTLVIVGTGIIMFSCWTAAKTVGMVLLTREQELVELKKILDAAELTVSDSLILFLMAAVLILFMSIGVAVRLFIGFSAIDVGRGRRQHRIYIPLTILFIINSIFTIYRMIVLFVDSVKSETVSTDTSLTAIIIELTSMIMMIQMVSAALKAGKITEAAGQAGETACS